MLVNGKGKVVNLYADRAATADNASKLSGQTITQVRTGINAATLGGKTVAQVVASTPRPAGVVSVAKTGGQFTSVSAALASINDNGPAHRYLVKVAPGTYTETGSVAMKNYVDIEGSGQNVTTITCACGSDTTVSNGGSNAVLRVTGPGVHVGIRDLTITNTNGNFLYSTGIVTVSTDPGDVTLDALTITATSGSVAVGILNHSSSPTMTNVTATAKGALTNYGIWNVTNSNPTIANATAAASQGANTSPTTNYGVYNESSSSTMTMTDVTATATGTNGAYNYGVYNYTSSPRMTDVTATAIGGNNNVGVDNYASSSPTMTNVTATATSADATGSTYGVYNNSSSPTMNNVTATGTGAATNYGVVNESSSSATMNNVTATGTGGTTNYGMLSDSSSATIRNSSITGSSYSIFNWSGSVSSTATVSSSTLQGGAVFGTGFTCHFNINASGAALTDGTSSTACTTSP
jgi:hypothetical protein